MHICLYMFFITSYIHTLLISAPQIASPYLTLAMAYEETGDMDKHYQVSSLCVISKFLYSLHGVLYILYTPKPCRNLQFSKIFITHPYHTMSLDIVTY